MANKYEEALNNLDGFCDVCFHDWKCEPRQTDGKCDSYKRLKAIIDNADKYKWHDLIKCPDDLPVNYGNKEFSDDVSVTVYTVKKRKCLGIEFETYDLDEYILKEKRFATFDTVLAWRYIETFESEE